MAFLTDFGQTDWYAGVLHGVVHRHMPGTNTIDITHQITPGNVREAAFILSCAMDYFPEGTIFCCIVDPGVGSERKALAIYDGRHYFVGPDNGIFSALLRENPRRLAVRVIENTKLMAARVDSTFHGRDVFAPVSAFLSSGGKFSEIGHEMDQERAVSIEEFAPIEVSATEYKLRVLYVDHFGNLFLNVRRTDFSDRELTPDKTALWTLYARTQSISGLKRTFSNVSHGEPVFYFGSCGYLELAINQGNAAKEFGLTQGDQVLLHLPHCS